MIGVNAGKIVATLVFPCYCVFRRCFYLSLLLLSFFAALALLFPEFCQTPFPIAQNCGKRFRQLVGLTSECETTKPSICVFVFQTCVHFAVAPKSIQLLVRREPTHGQNVATEPRGSPKGSLRPWVIKRVRAMTGALNSGFGI